MHLQYTANYKIREHYRCILMELERKMGITWSEEHQFIGCSSLESVFTIECRADQREAIEHRLLIRVPVYELEQWPEPYPVEYINVASRIQNVI